MTELPKYPVKPIFLGDVDGRWSHNGNHRDMTLLTEFTFIDPRGGRWVAPEGSVIDGASIPRFFWRLLGSPYTGKHRRASVIHDVACKEAVRPWPDIHRAFREACILAGMWKPKAWVLWFAISLCGPGSTIGGVLAVAKKLWGR